MATLSFGVVGPTLNFTVEMNIADTDAPRILAWLCSPKSGYGTMPDTVMVDVPNASWVPGDGQTEADRPTIQEARLVIRVAKVEEAAQNYARATLASLLASAVAAERQAAADAAMAAVSDIAVA